MYIGYSTGSVALSDFKLAIDVLKHHPICAIEISALREQEVHPLMKQISQLDLQKYQYISFHAPSKLNSMSEEELIEQLKIIVRMNWPVIVHPDIISDFSKWRVLGRYICVENMDKRKPCGRTAADLAYLFQQLPDATFCLDVAHARQVDPTMSQCYEMLTLFSDRLVQIHLSDVTSDSKHVPLNIQAVKAYERIIGYIPNNIPVIIESPIQAGSQQQERISKEIEIACELFFNQVVDV